MKNHKYYMGLAYHSANRSRDKSTKVGCTIVKDGIVLTESYNGFPRGINDGVKERYERPLKYIFTEHAERNAINNCAREGLSTNGATMYTTLMPCHECARSIIQAGIKTVVYLEGESERFVESSAHARMMLKEAGVELIEFEESADDTLHLFSEAVKRLRFMGVLYDPKEELESLRERDVKYLPFKKGDIIENNQDALRRIVSFNGDSYIWEYADIPSGERNEFDSISSNDPLFENWVKIN